MKTYVHPRRVFGDPDRTVLGQTMNDVNISLRELEGASGVSRSTLSNLSNGRGSVEVAKARNIADALDRPVASMFVLPTVEL